VPRAVADWSRLRVSRVCFYAVCITGRCSFRVARLTAQTGRGQLPLTRVPHALNYFSAAMLPVAS
jgi:hypothetical protein